MNDALSLHIEGQLSFSAHVCIDVTRRRALLSSDVEIATTATVRAAAYDDDDVQKGVVTMVSAAVDDGSLGESIVNGGVTSMTSISVTGATGNSPTPSPTLEPTPVPTPAPALASWWEPFAIAVTVVNLLVSVAFCLHMKKMLTKGNHAAVTDRLSNMNLFAMVLGWVDMVSDMLFAVEVRLERTRQPDLTN